MKKRFLKLMFVLTLMFGFTFTLASCNQNGTTSSSKVEPTPDPTPTPEPVSKTLTELPEGFYASLAPASNSIIINFNNFKATSKTDVEYEIDNDSYIRIGYVDDTLKANGSFKASYVNGKEICSTYLSFSLDDAFKAKAVNEVEPNLDYVAKFEDEFTGKKEVSYIYEEIELSKEKLIEFINAQLENADIDLDLNNVDSLDDITSVFGVSDELVGSGMELINTMFDSLMGLFFNETFDENKVTLEFTLDSLTLANLALSNATIETLADAILGEGFFDKILSYLEDYSVVDQTKVTAPEEGKQYFTYNAETGKYEMCENLTSWAPNTVYYVDNKDLGSYTLDDLIKTSDTDENGFVTTDSIDNGINKLFELIGKVMPMIQGAMGQGQSGADVDDDATLTPAPISTSALAGMFSQTMIIQMLNSIFNVNPYYLVEPVTGLTEWEGYIEGMSGSGTKYYSSIYEEATNLDAFDEDELYFTKVNDKYVLVDTKTTQAPVAGTTYYVFNPIEVDYKKLKTPASDVTYYVESEPTYSYDKVEIVAEWDAKTTYYTMSYEKVENLTAFEPNKNYYFIDQTGQYDLVNLEQSPTPVAGMTYYIEGYTAVDKTVVTAPENGVQYYVYLDIPESYSGYKMICTEFNTDLDGKVKPYYEKNGDDYVLTTDTTPVAGKTYYTQQATTHYVPCDGLTEFNPDVTYYLMTKSDDEFEMYEIFDIYELSTPDSTKVYYKNIDSIGKYLATEPMKKLSIDDILNKVYPMLQLVAMASGGKINLPSFDGEIKVDKILAPVVETIKEIKDTKIYTFVAKGIDSINPIYEEAHVTAWYPDTDYYTNEDGKYTIVNKDEVTSPAENVIYYTRYSRTADDVKDMIDGFIASFEENVTLKIITDNEAKIQKVEFELGFDKISGGITVDFTQGYKDDVKETLAYAKDYECTSFDNSTEAMENLLNEDVFKDYVDAKGATYSLIKQNGKYLGFNRTLNSQTNSYFFGVSNDENADYYSETNYYCDKHINVRVGCYDRANDDFEDFIFVYNVETKKFVYDEKMDIVDRTCFDYEKNEWVLYYNEVDTTTTPDPNTKYYKYENDVYGECFNLSTFDPNIKYYTKVEIKGDVNHPFKLKAEFKFTGVILYYVVFFPATQTN